jgi:hypothetical protein
MQHIACWPAFMCHTCAGVSSLSLNKSTTSCEFAAVVVACAAMPPAGSSAGWLHRLGKRDSPGTSAVVEDSDLAGDRRGGEFGYESRSLHARNWRTVV